MKASLCGVFFFIIYSSSLAGEWPVYRPAQVNCFRDPANSNNAQVNPDRIIVNDLADFTSEGWTIKIISSRHFEFWSNSQPQTKKLGHMKQDFDFPPSNVKILCRETIPRTLGLWIFSGAIPQKNDKFYISVISNGEKAGKISGGYCDFSLAVPVWHNYHSGVDIGEVGELAPPTPTPAPGDPTPLPGKVCHTYPVRSGEMVGVKLLTDGGCAVIVKTDDGVYDWYSYVQNDVFDLGNYTSDPILIEASGDKATRLSSFVNHDYPHLHYGVYSDDEATEPAGTRSIKNPLNNLVPNFENPVTPPAVIEIPNVPGICFRADDHGLPSPLPTPFTTSTIKANVDIEAKMLDFNGAPTQPMGVNQIGYYLYTGDGEEIQFLESRIFMNDHVWCGEPGQNEYSPYHFDEYGMNRVEFQTLYGRGPFPSVLMHNYYYILTNNQDISGGKAGFSTEGSWNTEETVGLYRRCDSNPV